MSPPWRCRGPKIVRRAVCRRSCDFHWEKRASWCLGAGAAGDGRDQSKPYALRRPMSTFTANRRMALSPSTSVANERTVTATETPVAAGLSTRFIRSELIRASAESRRNMSGERDFHAYARDPARGVPCAALSRNLGGSDSHDRDRVRLGRLDAGRNRRQDGRRGVAKRCHGRTCADLCRQVPARLERRREPLPPEKD